MSVAALLLGALPAGASGLTPVGVQIVTSSSSLNVSNPNGQGQRGDVVVTVINGDPAASAVRLLVVASGKATVILTEPGGAAVPACPLSDGAATGAVQCRVLPTLQGGESLSLQLDIRPAKAVALTAVSADGSVTHASVDSGLTSFSSWWATWWKNSLLPFLEAVAEILLLLIAISYLSSFLADVGSGKSWNSYLPRPSHMRLTGYIVAAIGFVRVLANWHGWPTSASWLSSNLFGSPGATDAFHWGGPVCLVLLAATAATVVVSVVGSRRDGPNVSVFRAIRLANLAWTVSAVTAIAVAVTITLWPESSRNLPAGTLGVVLVVVGTLLVAWQASFTPQVTIDATTKDSDQAKLSTRLPDSLRSIGDSTSSTLTLSDGQDQHSMPTEALKAAPSAGLVGGAVAAASAAAPRAGYRLTISSGLASGVITVQASLRRGSSECESVQFSSTDFLPDPGAKANEDHDTADDMAKAVGSWLFVTLNTRLKKPSWGLAGTTDWRSLALISIGTGYADEGDTASAQTLFERASRLDGGSLPARFNVISNNFAGAHEIDKLYQQCAGRYPLTPLLLKVAYTRAVASAFPHHAVSIPGPTSELVDLCRALTKGARIRGPRGRDLQAAVQDFDAAVRSVGSAPGPGRPLSVRTRWPDRPPRRDIQAATKYAAQAVLAPAAVLAARHLSIAALPAEVKRLKGPSAGFNLARLYVAGGNPAEAWKHLDPAIGNKFRASRAIRDPSLEQLWKTARGSYYVRYAARLHERSLTPHGTPHAFLDAGMEQLVAGYLCDVAHIATFEELNHILDQNWVGKSALWPAQVAKSLKAHDGRWKIAANGAVGPQVAAALGDIGHDDPSSLPVESDLYEMILAWHANHPDTKIPAPTLEVVKGWRLALGLPVTPPTTTAPTKPVPAKKAAAPASGVPAKKTAAPARKSPARKSPAARVGAPPGKGRGVPRSGN